MSATFSVYSPAKICSTMKSTKHSISYTMKVPNLSFHLIDRTDQNPHFAIISPPFSENGNSSDLLQFSLSLYPRGTAKNTEEYVGLFLNVLQMTAAPMPIKYKLEVLKENGKVFESLGEAAHLNAPESIGFSKFLKRQVLLKADPNLLPNDQLTIQCTIEALTQGPTETGQCRIDRMQQLTTESINQLGFDLSALLYNGTLHDVLLIVRDTKLRAHKLVLSARSTVLKATLDSSKTVSGIDVIEISGFDVAVVKDFLLFLYTGKVNLDKKAMELLQMANKYAVGTLKNLCEEHLSAKLALDTVIPMLVQADMHSAECLKFRAIDFIVINATRLLEIPKWDAQLQTRSDLYSEVFRRMAKALNPNGQT